MPTFIGKPVTVAEDKQLQVGDTLRDFNLTATDLTKKSLSEFDGKKKVISIVPSIDTGICSTQTRTFNKELSELDDTVVITISVDLPLRKLVGVVLKALKMPSCSLTTMIIVSVKTMVSLLKNGTC